MSEDVLGQAHHVLFALGFPLYSFLNSSCKISSIKSKRRNLVEKKNAAVYRGVGEVKAYLWQMEHAESKGCSARSYLKASALRTLKSLESL